MASPLDTARRHCVVIQKKSRRISALKTKKKAQANGLKLYDISNTDSVLEFWAVKALMLLISKYAARLLTDSNRRRAVRTKFKTRLRIHKRGEFFEFGEQVVLANLYWGIQSLEKAIHSTSAEARNAGLENAERMLQVPALVDEDATTAGMPNSYIICCAYFHLALVWKLRKNEWQMALHLLQAFVVSPHYCRLDFAPGLWKQIFLPHVSFLANEFVCATGVSEGVGIEPDELHLKKTRKHFSDKISNVEILRSYYNEALNKATRKRAKYYKDWLTYYTVVYSGNDAVDSLCVDKQICEAKLVHAEHTDTQKKTGRNEDVTHLRKDLYEKEPLKKKSLESLVDQAKANDAFNRIHVGMACLPDLSAEESLMSNEGKDCSGKLCFIYKEKEDVGTTSPLLQMEDCQASTGKHGRFCYLMSKENGEIKCLSEILREPQSDMSISTDSHSSSGEEETDLEEKTENESTLEAAACPSVRNVPKTEQFESTELDINSGRLSYEKVSEGASYGQICPIRFSNNICTPLHQQSPDLVYSTELDINSGRLSYEKISEGASYGQICPITFSNNIFTPLHQQSPDLVYSTESDIDSGRQSYEKISEGASYGQICPIRFSNNISTPLHQQSPDSIIEATNESFRKTSVLPDQSCSERINSCDFSQPTIKNVTRQWFDQCRSEALDSLQQIKYSLPDFGAQVTNEDGVAMFTSDRCFDYHLSKPIRRSDIIKVKQLGNSARRKLDFPDNISVCQLGNPNNTKYCQAVEKEVEFEQAICILCTSDEIKKCEKAVLTIKYLWADLKNKTEAESVLLRAAVVDQLTEILLASRVEDVLRATICILSLLVIRDKFIVHNILKNDPELYFVSAILKRRKIYEAAILLYLLEPSAVQMKTLDVLAILVEVIYDGNYYVKGPISLPWTPSSAAVMIIEILVTSFDYLTNDSHLQAILSLNILPGLVDILKSENMEVRVAAVSVLTLCMRSDGTCRHFISQRTPMASIVQLLHAPENGCKSVALEFISEVICLQRNSSMVGILRQIQQQGVFSSMHILMAYIQHVPLEHQPFPAGLILQLDMLVESQGQSIFRDEAVEVLLAAISCEDSTSAQIASSKVLASLGGRFSYTGEPATVVWLIKKAGLSPANLKYISGDLCCLDHCMQEEDPDAVSWSNKIAKKVMLSGTPVFEALKKGLKSNVSEVARNNLITVAWLGYELSAMQRNRLRPIARDIILPEIVAFMQPGIELEERVLASLSIYNYTAGSGMQQLLKFSRELHGPLRRLAAFTWTAEELSKVIAYSSPSRTNTTCGHKQVIEIGDDANGAALALIQYKGKLYSGHSDGSIKVWEVNCKPFQLLQQVREHKKSVTCFSLLEPSKCLISGSADKTVRIWNGLQGRLECIMVMDIMDSIHEVDSHGEMLFLVTKSCGVKVQHGQRVIKVLNENKQVQSLVVSEDKIFCGCKDSSIQEIDVAGSQAKQIQGCARTWMGKKPVYAIVPFRDWIYTAGALVDGFNLKVWRRQDGAFLSMASTGSDVRAMAVTEDFIYLNCSSSPAKIQIWLREKLQKVTSWSVGSRITSLLASNDVIFCGTDNGMIKAWVPI